MSISDERLAHLIAHPYLAPNRELKSMLTELQSHRAASQARALSSGEGDVPWPGREFCETAERNVMKLAEHLRGNRHYSVACDAGIAIRALLPARPQPPSKDNTNE